MLESRASNLERAECSPVFPLGGVWLVLIFIKPGERTLCLPLQKNRAVLGLGNLVERAFRARQVMLPRGNLPLDQARINLVAFVAIGLRHGERFGAILFRLVQLTGLLGNKRQGL